MSFEAKLTQIIWTACRWEASATKPGNVHPSASFADLTYEDFLVSAEFIAPILAKTERIGIGTAILQAVEATFAQLGKNTNLGIALLIAPLAAVPQNQSLSGGTSAVLAHLTIADAALAYRAIRIANPSGMGRVQQQDIHSNPTETLLQVMQSAAERDAVAAEYAHGFPTVLQFGYPFLRERLPSLKWKQILQIDQITEELNSTIVELHVRLMARKPDTLIARKCGEQTAARSAQWAADLLEQWNWQQKAFQNQLQHFDQWLRADGHKRNPGTTADLVAACLFAWLRETTLRQ